VKGIDISPEWQAAAEHVSQDPGIYLVVGVPDSGKSTLSRFLVRYLTNARRTVALIDCDVGQTILGPPTTIGMMLYPEPTDQVDTLEPDCMRFIGATSPIGHLLETIGGAKRMADKALSEQAEVVVINTSGLILGVPGTELKLNKVDLLCPRCVLALQESSQIEPLLSHLERRPGLSVVRLPISNHARKRPLEVRRRLREEKYRQYFQETRMVKMPISQIGSDGQVLSRDMNVPIDAMKNLLLGLCDSENYLLALGILQDLNLAEQSLHILTPLNSEVDGKVARIQVGEIKIHPDGQEEYVGRESHFFDTV
jgi:polynucleotide 5'-hydroxyl-kinase GRC3/NOL9